MARQEGLVGALRERPGSPVRAQAPRARDRDREKFRVVFDNAAIGIALVDMDGHPVESNSALERMLGYSAGELKRMVFTDFPP